MRVNEVAASEARLTEINQQLNFHMSQMVRQHDLDKTEALERWENISCLSVKSLSTISVQLYILSYY